MNIPDMFNTNQAQAEDAKQQVEEVMTMMADLKEQLELKATMTAEENQTNFNAALKMMKDLEVQAGQLAQKNQEAIDEFVQKFGELRTDLNSANQQSKEQVAQEFQRNMDKLKRLWIVAGMEDSSNCEVLVGPVGSWTTRPFSTQGEISIDVTRSPRLVKFQ